MTVEWAIGGKSITVNKAAFAKPVDDLKKSLQAVNVCTAELIATIVKQKTCSITVTLLNKCHYWGALRNGKSTLLLPRRARKECTSALFIKITHLALVSVTNITTFVNTACVFEKKAL